MTLKELKALKDAAEQLHHGCIEYAKAMLHYHSEAAEYWDGRYGSTYNDDEKCTANWNKHNKAASNPAYSFKARPCISVRRGTSGSFTSITARDTSTK